MKTINTQKPVMVTGATGYVAGWIVKKLLEKGLTVHAPIRTPENKDKTKYLDEIAKNSNGEIKYFKADLLNEGSYEEAMKGCELIYHTASPFTSKIKDPQKDLVDPALNGTKNILKTANKLDTVKRIVLTSSCAAIIGDTKDLLSLPNGTATEENWNTTSTLTHQSYSYSKTVAEKKAWEISEAQKQWDLVVINPTLVLGPGINPHSTSESYNIIKQMGDGTMKSGVPAMDIGIVDVRDVATAHINAGFMPEAKGRHIISSENKTLLQLSEVLKEKYGNDYPFPKKELPKFMVWLVAPFVGLKRKMVSRNIGYPWLVDNTKSKEKLNIEYTPTKKTMIDFFQQMIDNNVFK